jgi:hypothetical protein
LGQNASKIPTQSRPCRFGRISPAKGRLRPCKCKKSPRAFRGPDVDVGTKEKEITVPDVDVSVRKKKTTVTVPDIKVDIPQENEETIDASSDDDK